MNEDLILDVAKESILVVIFASMPAILASLIVGLIIAIFSATTQIQETTLSFAPKMIAVYFSLILFGATTGNSLITFARRCFSLFAD